MGVAKITPENRALRAPAPLRDLPVWLVWRYEPRHADDPKPLKVPYYSRGGRRAGKQGTPEDRAKLTTFDVAQRHAASRGMSGVGIAPLEGYDIVALDFDNCVTDGAVPPDIAEAIRGSYAEFSPSGRGVRALMRGNLGNRKTPTTQEQYGFETFSTSGFVTITGDMLPHIEVLGYEDTVAPVTDAVVALCARRFTPDSDKQAPDPDDFMLGHEPRLDMSVEEIEALLAQLDPDMGREEWITVGMALHHECEGDDTGFQIWDEWSAGGGKYLGEEDLRTQWESFERRAGERRRNVTMRTVKWMVSEASKEASKAPLDAAEVAATAQAAVASLPSPEGRMRTPEGFAGKFPIQSADMLSAQRPTSWLIKGVLPAADLVVLYGASGSGKSFVLLDMLASVARGEPWRERKSRKGRCLILAAEGAGGYGKRITALCQQRQLDATTLDIGVVTVPPNLMEREDIMELVLAVAAIGGVDVIAIDTFAQATPGANENAGEDMGLAIRNCRVLHDATGATIILVHHAGKDLHRGSRGWSGIRAAADAEIEVSRDEVSGYRGIRLSKQKDGEDGLQFGFKLETVVVGMDEDGDETTSCVVVDADPPKPEETERKGVKRRGHIQNHVLEVLQIMQPEQGIAKLDVLIAKAVDMLPAPEEGKLDLRRQNVTRAIRLLSKEKDGPVGLDKNIVIFYG